MSKRTLIFDEKEVTDFLDFLRLFQGLVSENKIPTFHRINEFEEYWDELTTDIVSHSRTHPEHTPRQLRVTLISEYQEEPELEEEPGYKEGVFEDLKVGQSIVFNTFNTAFGKLRTLQGTIDALCPKAKGYMVLDSHNILQFVAARNIIGCVPQKEAVALEIDTEKTKEVENAV